MWESISAFPKRCGNFNKFPYLWHFHKTKNDKDIIIVQLNQEVYNYVSNTQEIHNRSSKRYA